jgi:hypothetical protein
MIDNITDTAWDCELPKMIDDGISDNYGEWKTKSFHQLRSCGLWKYIESSPPIVPPLRGTADCHSFDDNGYATTIQVAGNKDEHQRKSRDFERWMTGNNLVLSKIVLAVPDAQLHLVMHAEFAKDAWESLRSYYHPRNDFQVTRIKGDIATHRCTPDMDVGKWLHDMQCLYSSLCLIDRESLSDRQFAITILLNMPQDGTWWSLRSTLRSKVEEDDIRRSSPTLIESVKFIAAIREEIWHRNRHNSQTRAHISSARAEAEKKAQRLHPRASHGASSSNPTKRRRTLSDKRCINPHCGVPEGHNFADCVAYGGGSQGKYGPGWKGLWNIHLPAEQRTKANNVPPWWHPAYAPEPIFD